MPTLEGSHGTTISSYENIKKFGWRTSSGRGGTAVYFWKKSGRYIDLARAWYNQCRTEGRYSRRANTACNIILAEMECDEEGYYDTLGDSEFKDTIDRFATEKKLGYGTTRQISALMDLFVSEMEKEEGVSYKVLCLEVAPPKPEYIDYPIMLLGAPVCYAVRDADCIDIVDSQTC